MKKLKTIAPQIILTSGFLFSVILMLPCLLLGTGSIVTCHDQFSESGCLLKRYVSHW